MKPQPHGLEEGLHNLSRNVHYTSHCFGCRRGGSKSIIRLPYIHHRILHLVPKGAVLLLFSYKRYSNVTFKEIGYMKDPNVS